MAYNFDLVSITAKIICDFIFTFFFNVDGRCCLTITYRRGFGLHTTIKIHFCICFSHKRSQNVTMREDRVNSQHLKRVKVSCEIPQLLDKQFLFHRVCRLVVKIDFR